MLDAQATRAAVLDQQRSWADLRRIELCGDEHVASWQDNLTAPLAAATREELNAWLASERDGKPGRLNDLGSGLALALNVFEPWRGHESELAGKAPLLGSNMKRIRFGESWGDTHADQLAPLDLLLETDTRPTAVVPLFAEPYAEVDPRVPSADLRPKAASLPGAASLARDLDDNPGRFGRLPAGRVLALAEALTTRFGRHGFRLAILWYDAPGRAARRLRQEIAALRMRIGGEVEVCSETWQNLFCRLRSAGLPGRVYGQTLQARYFPASRDPRPQ